MHIIIVEDEAAHAEAIRRALKDAGMKAQVEVAGTLREYQHIRPRLCLTSPWLICTCLTGLLWSS